MVDTDHIAVNAVVVVFVSIVDDGLSVKNAVVVVFVSIIDNGHSVVNAEMKFTSRYYR